MNTVALKEVLGELAPSGNLRAAINLSNPALARGTPTNPSGIAVDLANELGRRLGLGVELICFDSAGKVVEALKSSTCDVAFMAIDPGRAADFTFSPSYMIIDGAYLVQEGSPYREPQDLDIAGRRIAVTQGTAYAQFLTRELKAASLIRSEDGVATFRSGDADAAAGIRIALNKYAAENPDVRVMTQPFMQIRQAIAIGSGRPAASAYIADFINTVCDNGFVQGRLKRGD